MLKTAFWRNAADSLPASVRARYVGHFEDAERWELRLDAAIEAWREAVRRFDAFLAHAN